MYHWWIPVKETLPKPRCPIWYSSNQTLSASTLALILVSSSPFNDAVFSSSFVKLPSISTTNRWSSNPPSPPPQHPPLTPFTVSDFRWWWWQWSSRLIFLLRFLFRPPRPIHFRPIIHGTLTKASVRRFTTAQGQQQSATQSAIAAAAHDRHLFPEHLTPGSSSAPWLQWDPVWGLRETRCCFWFSSSILNYKPAKNEGKRKKLTNSIYQYHSLYTWYTICGFMLSHIQIFVHI